MLWYGDGTSVMSRVCLVMPRYCVVCGDYIISCFVVIS